MELHHSHFEDALKPCVKPFKEGILVSIAVDVTPQIQKCFIVLIPLIEVFQSGASFEMLKILYTLFKDKDYQTHGL